MLDTLKYRNNLWTLQRKKDKISKFYSNEVDKAEKKNSSHDEIGHIFGEERHFLDQIDEEIAQLQDRFLRGQAEKYLIPFPKHITDDGTWEKSRLTGRRRLSQKTVSELKTSIREEQKDRREKWQGWLALLVGFIGALIGLISVL